MTKYFTTVRICFYITIENNVFTKFFCYIYIEIIIVMFVFLFNK